MKTDFWKGVIFGIMAMVALALFIFLVTQTSLNIQPNRNMYRMQDKSCLSTQRFMMKDREFAPKQYFENKESPHTCPFMEREPITPTPIMY